MDVLITLYYRVINKTEAPVSSNTSHKEGEEITNRHSVAPTRLSLAPKCAGKSVKAEYKPEPDHRSWTRASRTRTRAAGPGPWQARAGPWLARPGPWLAGAGPGSWQAGAGPGQAIEEEKTQAKWSTTKKEGQSWMTRS